MNKAVSANPPREYLHAAHAAASAPVCAHSHSRIRQAARCESGDATLLPCTARACLDSNNTYNREHVRECSLCIVERAHVAHQNESELSVSLLSEVASRTARMATTYELVSEKMESFVIVEPTLAVDVECRS